MTSSERRTVTVEEVVDALDEQPSSGVQHAVFHLDRLDTAWNPKSTRHLLVMGAPTVVTYYRYPDGGITAVVGRQLASKGRPEAGR